MNRRKGDYYCPGSARWAHWQSSPLLGPGSLDTALDKDIVVRTGAGGPRVIGFENLRVADQHGYACSSRRSDEMCLL